MPGHSISMGMAPSTGISPTPGLSQPHCTTGQGWHWCQPTAPGPGCPAVCQAPALEPACSIPRHCCCCCWGSGRGAGTGQPAGKWALPGGMALASGSCASPTHRHSHAGGSPEAWARAAPEGWQQGRQGTGSDSGTADQGSAFIVPRGQAAAPAPRNKLPAAPASQQSPGWAKQAAQAEPALAQETPSSGPFEASSALL